MIQHKRVLLRKMENQQLTEEQYNKLKKIRYFNIALDIFAVITLISAMIYFYSEAKTWHIMNEDYCAMCKLKTNATCIFGLPECNCKNSANTFPTDFKINISK